MLFTAIINANSKINIGVYIIISIVTVLFDYWHEGKADRYCIECPALLQLAKFSDRESRSNKKSDQLKAL